MRWWAVAALLSVAWDLSAGREPSLGWALVCACVIGPIVRRL